MILERDGSRSLKGRLKILEGSAKIPGGPTCASEAQLETPQRGRCGAPPSPHQVAASTPKGPEIATLQPSRSSGSTSAAVAVATSSDRNSMGNHEDIDGGGTLGGTGELWGSSFESKKTHVEPQLCPHEKGSTPDT